MRFLLGRLKDLNEQQRHTQLFHQHEPSDQLRDWEQNVVLVRDTGMSVAQAQVRLYKSLQLTNPSNLVPLEPHLDGYMRGPFIQALLELSDYNQLTISLAASRKTGHPQA